MPGKQYSHTLSSYRYGFNGHEESKEVSKGSYTAEFWQYDSRLGKRWNLDPKPNISMSPYSCFAGNPILFIDPFGDTLELGGDINSSKNDIKSLVRNNNQKYISFDGKNRVTLNFSGLTENERNSTLQNDKGLSLINEIANSNRTILYEATDLGFYSNTDGGREMGILRFNDVNGVKNTSNFGADSDNGYSERPRMGYDGHLMIDTKTTWEEEIDESGNSASKPRSSMVFHELAENFYRTHHSVNYQPVRRGTGLNRIGAHQIAINLERTWHGSSNSPGGVSKINFAPISASEITTANQYNHIYRLSGLTREDLSRIFSIIK